MTSTGSHTPGMALGSPKKSSFQALPGPMNKGGSLSPTKGSPTKQLPRYMEVGAPKSIDPKLGPRRPGNVRNLPKIERKSAVAAADKAQHPPERKSERKLKQERDTIRALRGGNDGDKTGSGIGKRSIVNGVKELDPVKESPGENQEE